MRSRLVRTLSLLVALCLWAGTAHAQYTRISSGTAAPSGGVDGNVYIRTGATLPGFYINISGWIGPFNTPIGNVTTTATLTAGKAIIGAGTTAIDISSLTATVVKSSTGTLSAASAGTDYVAPGSITTSGLTMNTARLLGRTTASSGAVEEITVGSGLSLSAGSLTATGGGTGTVTNTGTLTAHAVMLGNGGVDITALGSLGTNGQVLTSGGAGVDPSWTTVAGTGTVTTTGSPANGDFALFSGSTSITNGTINGRLIGIQVITATGAGTYTPTAGTVSIVLELQGGGGGGGGVSQPSGTTSALAGGGGGGGYIRTRLTTNFSGASYVVGAKGTGGTAGANNGVDGTSTTFTDTAGSPTTYTAAGGSKGLGSASQGGNVGFATTGSSAGGTCTNGDIKIPGGASSVAYGLAAGQGLAGVGGDSFLGRGGRGSPIVAANTSNAGTAATGFGGGGSGAVAGGTGTAKAGGDGTDGIIVIWEFS